jgi:hypothetical protein
LQQFVPMLADLTQKVTTIQVVFDSAYISRRYTRSRCHNRAAAIQHEWIFF